LQDDSDDEDEPVNHTMKSEWEEWQSHSIAVRSSIGMPPGHVVWTDTARLLGLPPNSDRYKDLIQVAYYNWKRHQGVAVVHKPKLCVDLSQGIQRRPWSQAPRTLGQTSLVYVFALDRVLDGEDRLRTLAAGRRFVLRFQVYRFSFLASWRR